MTEFQCKRRLIWAKEHLLWTIKDWKKIIFYDIQFCVSGNQFRGYVRQCTHEEFSLQCLKSTIKYPIKAMVLGCMPSRSFRRLHIGGGTVKVMEYIEILQNKLIPTSRDLFGNQSWNFRDDNIPYHRVNVVQKWFKDHTLNRMNWPG